MAKAAEEAMELGAEGAAAAARDAAASARLVEGLLRHTEAEADAAFDLAMGLLREKLDALNGMQDFFGKIEVPSEEITEMKGGKEKTIQKKFFPGYILVEMEMNDDTWHLVKETPRVLGFIGGTKTNPRPISENEANRILNQIESGVETTSQQNIYEAGEMIRVIDGPFNDFSGVIEEVDSEKGKVKVAVMIFGRSTPVELDFNQIERA